MTGPRQSTRRLHIGVAAPVSLQMIAPLLAGPKPTTNGLQSALIADFCIDLHRRGHDLEIFTLSLDELDVGDFSGDRISLHVRKYRQRLRWIDAFRIERRALRLAMAASQCEIIHAHWGYEFGLAAQRSGKPVLITLHDWAPEIFRLNRDRYRLARLAMQQLVVQRAKFVTANSPYIASLAKRSGLVDIPVIPNGIKLPHSPASPLTNTSPVIGALNNGFGARKNVVRLIESFALVRETFPKAKMRLAGHEYGPSEAAERWAVDHELHRGIEFVGPIPSADVRGFMQSLNLFVHPSLEESFGMVLIEALAAGTPVVAGTKSGAVPWVLGDGVAGTLVDVASAQTLSEAIGRLLTDSDALRASAAAGFGHVQNNFSLEHVVDLYEAQYEAIVESNC